MLYDLDGANPYKAMNKGQVRNGNAINSASKAEQIHTVQVCSI